MKFDGRDLKSFQLWSQWCHILGKLKYSIYIFEMDDFNFKITTQGGDISKIGRMM